MERTRHDTRSSRHRVPHQQHYVARPLLMVLGRSYNTWTVPFLRAFLSHYGRPQAHATSKSRLLHLMGTLAWDYNLDGSDYDEMYSAYWTRHELPERKTSRVAVSLPSSTLRPATSSRPEAGHQAASSPPTASHPSASFRQAASRPRATIRPQATLRPASLTGPTQHAQLQDSHEKEISTRPDSKNPLLKSRETCIVCWDDLTPQTTPQESITSECAHEINLCRSCASLSISSQLDGKMWDQISCPACEAKIEYASVQKFASATTLARYDQLALQAIVQASGGHLQQCRHPGCTSIQECFPDTDSYMICQQCSGRTCITCDVTFHAGISCTDRNDRVEAGLSTDPNDLATEQLLASKAKNCPKCGIRGIKAEGCDHMTCPRCSYQYCWLCFANYVEVSEMGNEAHKKTCRYHSSNLSPENDYEVDDEDGYGDVECDGEDDGAAGDEETDRRIDPSPPSINNRAEETSPDASLTPSNDLAHQTRAFQDRVAAYGIGSPNLPLLRDSNVPQERDRTNINNLVREDLEGAVVDMASVMRDLRRRAIARLPQR